MHCYNEEERRNRLMRCGCRRCEDEYYRMRDYDRRDYYNRAISYSPPPRLTDLSTPLQMTIKVEPKMKEPKNIAVKLLVDELKAEQSSLANNTGTLKTFEASAKTYREARNKNLKAIKELATALKKLGHKEEVA